jgi:ssDNA-binding Zn-finger/Zn-ribbon topoisomerase 1
MITWDYTCPECGGAMRLKTNKRTHEQFWGCTFYPECTGTRNYKGDGRDDRAPDALPSARAKWNDRSRWRNE